MNVDKTFSHWRNTEPLPSVHLEAKDLEAACHHAGACAAWTSVSRGCSVPG